MHPLLQRQVVPEWCGMSDTAIEWTEKTWNPTTGCDQVSPGCDNCYALTLAKRLKGMGAEKYQKDGIPETSGPGFGITEHPASLTIPLSWRKPQKVFVNSMSDLFHKGISDEFIAKVFAVMAATPRHTYQVLTKRHGRMRSLLSSDAFRQQVQRRIAGVGNDPYVDRHWKAWPLPNVWLGVSVENQEWAGIRIPALLDTPAAVRFLSCEPLLGPVLLRNWVLPHCGCCTPLLGRSCVNDPGAVSVDWVIAGGESGAGFRPLNLDWVRSLRDQCAESEVAFLFKQVGGRTPKSGGRTLDDETWDQYPETAA